MIILNVSDRLIRFLSLKSRTRRLLRLVGLGILITLVGYLTLTRPLQDSQPDKPEVIRAIGASNQRDLSPTSKSMPFTSSQATVARLTLVQGIDWGFGYDPDTASLVTDPYGNPFFLPPKTQFIDKMLTLPFFGFVVELSSHFWLIEGQRWHFVFYLEISLIGLNRSESGFSF